MTVGVLPYFFQPSTDYSSADVGAYSYGLGHPMKPLRMRITHELLTAYDMLDKMDVLVCVLLFVLLLSESRGREQSVQVLKP